MSSSRSRGASTPPGDGEVLVTGSRVLLHDGTAVLAVDENLRYGPIKSGYHGGVPSRGRPRHGPGPRRRPCGRRPAPRPAPGAVLVDRPRPSRSRVKHCNRCPAHRARRCRHTRA